MWNLIGLFLLSFAVVYATRPKIQAPKPAGIDEFQAPTADSSREIPVLFGSKLLNGPNVVYYGDLSVSPIRKKAGK